MENTKDIIALDLSLNSSGYVICNDDFFIKEIGTIAPFEKWGLGKRLNAIREKFQEIDEQNNIGTVIIERGFTRFNKATQQLYRVHGIANQFFYKYEQIYYPPKQIKYAITNNGNAKKEVVRDKILEMYPGINFKNLDESDAFAILVYHVMYKLNKGVGNLCIHI